MSDDVRLDLLRDAIANSKLDGQTKDVLADDLRYAQEINGTDDASLRGIKRLIISGIRKELLAHERVTKSIKEHIDNCPGAKLVKMATKSPAEQPHGFARWLVLLMPYRWPLAMVISIMFLSPNAPQIIQMVSAAFGRG
jgi:hypothetical protein